jgi:hypothetical protein
MGDPAADGFVRDDDPALREQVFDIPKAQSKSKVKPDAVLDDIRWKAVAAVADRPHPRYYRMPRFSPRDPT